MTYPPEPLVVIGQSPLVQFERGDASPPPGRSQVKLLLLGNPDAVDQCVIELERRGFCDSYAWSPPLLIRENAPPIQPRLGELLRVYQRWYPLTGQRIPF